MSDSVANNKVVYYFHVKCIRNFAPDGHGTQFSAWQRSEGIICRVTCGVCIILVVVQTTIFFLLKYPCDAWAPPAIAVP